MSVSVFPTPLSGIQEGIVNAKGDLIAATADNTLSRLAVGTNGQILTADSSEATGLKFATPTGATRAYAVFYDEKAQSISGGTFTSGAWRTRDLQTTQINNITSCSLSSNQISLPAGTYFVISRAPAYGVYRHQSRLQNITDSSTTILGATGFTATPDNGWNDSFIFGQFTIAGTKTFELQHQCSNTKAGDGFGTATDAFVSVSIYSYITIEKI